MKKVGMFILSEVLPYMDKGKGIANILSNIFILQFIVMSILIPSDVVDSSGVHNLGEYLNYCYSWFIAILSLRVGGGISKSIVEKVADHKKKRLEVESGNGGKATE